MSNDVVYAPSFGEVNNDNDELRELRGEGRYFGVEDPENSGPICSNCHQRGHRRNQCKTVVCHLCGKIGDHYESQCPNSMVCTNCGKKGHYKSQCTERHRYNYCTYCNSRSHPTDRCPNIWRSYIVLSKKKISYPTGKVYCYNCGKEGHFGDDCPSPRVTRTPNINGSAFNGENLPQQLRDTYRKKLRVLRDKTKFPEHSNKHKLDLRQEAKSARSSKSRKNDVKRRKREDRRAKLPTGPKTAKKLPKATRSGYLKRD